MSETLKSLLVTKIVFTSVINYCSVFHTWTFHFNAFLGCNAMWGNPLSALKLSFTLFHRVKKFQCSSSKERDHSEDPGVGGRIRSECILGRLTGGVDWIRLAQDRDLWRAVVNAVMNLRVLAPRS
jgi:hypothetical protein